MDLRFWKRKPDPITRWYPIPRDRRREFCELCDRVRQTTVIGYRGQIYRPRTPMFDLSEFIWNHIPASRDRQWSVRFIGENNPGIDVSE